MHQIEEWHGNQANDDEDGSRCPQQGLVWHPELESQEPRAYQRAKNKRHLRYQHQQGTATQQRRRLFVEFSHSPGRSLSWFWTVVRFDFQRSSRCCGWLLETDEGSSAVLLLP